MQKGDYVEYEFGPLTGDFSWGLVTDTDEMGKVQVYDPFMDIEHWCRPGTVFELRRKTPEQCRAGYKIDGVQYVENVIEACKRRGKNAEA